MAPSQILFFGDSITVGYTDRRGLGWPGRICRGLYDDNGRATTVYNLGINGDTWRGCAGRWSSETAARCTDRPLGALVFAFGVNDAVSIHGEGPQVTRDESTNYATEIITAAAQAAPVLWIGPAPVDERVNAETREDTNWSVRNTDLTRYSNAYADAAAHIGVPYLDLMTALKDDSIYNGALAASDYIHPTDAGYDRIAQAIMNWDPWLALTKSDTSNRRT